jgi:hypothetical protein
MVGAYGWWWYKRRFNSHFDRLVREFKRREYWNIEQFRVYQEEQLKKILAAAWNSPRYSQTFKAAGISHETGCVAIVVSQTSGTVRLFRRGQPVLELAPRARRS